jgi:hypothetical protein
MWNMAQISATRRLAVAVCVYVHGGTSIADDVISIADDGGIAVTMVLLHADHIRVRALQEHTHAQLVTWAQEKEEEEEEEGVSW